MTRLLNLWVLIFKSSVPAAISTDYHQILTTHSSYYRHLDPRLQQRFRRRLYQLLNVLSFRSAHFRVVTREMRVVIGCAIIEITFGLRSFLPHRFTRVVVMARSYMYPGYGQPFLGHVDHKHDMVYFSWADVQQGYRIPDDAVNVALHEMAHVIEHEYRYYTLFNRFFEEVEWKRWAMIAFQKMETIRREQHYFLKSYGGINMSEMFAVCVETFFEQSAEFKEALPELYQALVRLLRQDPAQRSNPILR